MSGRLLLRLGVAAFAAIMLAGPGAAVFPSTLRWSAWAACPPGTSPSPQSYRTYTRPGETTVAVSLRCFAPDGTDRGDHTLAAIGGLFAMYFVGLTVLLTLLSLRRSSPVSGSAAGPGVVRDVPPVEAKARELVARGQRIAAIKVVRQATNLGLKEAKDWVEDLPNRPSSPPPATALPSAGAAARLAELERLYDAGLITGDEFEAKRAEILAAL